MADGELFYSRQFEGEGTEGLEVREDVVVAPNKVKARFREFIRNFREVSSQTFPYRVQLTERFRRGEFKLVVELEHLSNYDEELLDLLLKKPKLYLGLFEQAARDALIQTTPDYNPTESGPMPVFQILLTSRQKATAMRDISAQEVNRLLLIPGIVTAAHRIVSKATSIRVACAYCGMRETISVPELAETVPLPRICRSEECKKQDPYKVLPDLSTFVDTQRLKLQEAPESVPTGEMPRSIVLEVNRNLVDQVSPGARVKVMGIWSIRLQGEKNKATEKNGPVSKHVKQSFLHVVGIQAMEDETGRGSNLFTPEEEQTFHDLSRKPDIYSMISRSIAPAISGDYTHDIKKAIACLLFGGTQRVLPDGLKLRGDVNVLLLGDPSTAKSQFLKFAERVAPIGVYTSGKGSSAAGLTANVIRDSRGEFYLEGGAMVLADGGVVCIDEFDKMREQDRVAIHEAMEQQTISVAKAGITTVLNSRCSVLAAANPVHGTYNDLKSAAENIDFLPTILSRFDLIFIVRDIRDERKDRNIARHVIGVHVEASTSAGNFQSSTNLESDEVEIGLLTLKKYIKYCRLKNAPVLSTAAAEMLRNHYVGVREEHRKRTRESRGGVRKATIPITVRQLEALVRISEALAKMELSHEVSPEHVTEAIRLFKVSTLNAASNCANPGDLGSLTKDQVQEIQAVEDQFKRRVPIGSTVPQKNIMDEFIVLQGYSQFAVQKAIQILLERGEIKHASQQKLIKRVR